ncbi:MAG: S8 family serine peptidase [Candidatus Geothermincolia bacterium]
MKGLLEGELCPAATGGTSEAACQSAEVSAQDALVCKTDVTFPKNGGDYKISISTVRLGPEIAKDTDATNTLTDLARETGGVGGTAAEFESYDVSGSYLDAKNKLENVYVHMLTHATGGVNLFSQDNDIGRNETRREFVDIDSSIREATFIVTWADSAVGMELVLKTPQGSYIDPIAAAAAEGIHYVKGSTYQLYHVVEPAVGRWELIVTAAASTSYTAMAIADSTMQMALDFDKLAFVKNDPITLSVKVFEPSGALIKGAQVGGFVQSPANINEITLNDLGQAGDPVASDGVYTGVYTGAVAQGAYTFSLRATGLNSKGEAFSREDLRSIYVASTTGPESPQRFTATGGNGSVDLSWVNPMSMNLEAVRIMRSTANYPANVNEGVMVYDGLSPPFRDTSVANGTTYYYSAFARNTNQEYSLPTDESRAAATPREIDTEPPQPIRDFVAIPGNNSVSLYWSNPLNTDFSHVLILRTAGACASTCSDPNATVFQPPAGSTSFTDTMAVNGVTYCYAIFAVDTSGNCSGAGTNSSGTATPQAPVIPPAVNDPLFSMQWHLHNEGQTGGKVDADMDAPEAWQIEQGSNQVVIAIIDTGVDYNHPDLSFNIWKNYREIPDNHLDDDANGYVDDYHGYDFTAGDADPKDDFGHGTHCAGIADAVTNNGIGVAGVARQAKIQAVKVLDHMGSGYWEWVAAGIVYAADNGADVISMSLGGPYSRLVEDACNYARDKGVVVVAAAGNSATSAKSYPAGSESVIAVSATDHNDQLAWFSNFGDWVDVSAPGVNVLATMPTYTVTMNIFWGLEKNYSHMSGTSMACPNVAGLAALILARYPDLTNEQVREALINTGDDLGTPGFDPYFGYGRINAANAMRMDKVGPLEVSKWRIDDDALSPSRGNGDKVINPGERVSMFLSVKNRGGQNAGAVTALLTTTDPYVTGLDATPVTFVSVPRWSTSESTVPAVFEVAPDTPVAHYISFHAVLTDEQGGRWEEDFVVSVGIYGPSLRVAEYIIDDDNNQESKGNGDGIVNTGETVELQVRLRNDGDLPAAAVQAKLSTRDPYITITDGSEDFGDIPPAGNALCQFDYDFVVSHQCPDNHPVTLNLEITDRDGRVWADTIAFTVLVPPPEVRYQSHRIAADYHGIPPGSGEPGEGDGGITPGETAELEILVQNRSVAKASGVKALLATADPLVSVSSAPVDYGDVLGKATGVPGKSRFVSTVDPGHAIGGSASFTLTVSDSAGLSWSDTFPVHISGLSAVAGQVRDATGAGIAQATVRYTATLTDGLRPIQ